MWRPLLICDPACGSGQMIMVTAEERERKHHYYGIDIDPTCVKMTALNLFLTGTFNYEVMCGNALLPDDFHGSYFISKLPFDIFRNDQKEKSFVWQMMNRKQRE